MERGVLAGPDGGGEWALEGGLSGWGWGEWAPGGAAA